ncbi:hypothetical protein M9Y10_043259 [Tritrichomonas musculus]|uniref:Uncharacterized protein n=1 Tax=Tritrichomonas musculus TaxID=1915356 RepID=A0ABR2JZ87_9EUKA
MLYHKSQKLISELEKAVGKENVESFVYNIRGSELPQFYTLSALSNGQPIIFQRAMKAIHDCGINFPPDFKLPIRKNWLMPKISNPYNIYQRKFTPYQNIGPKNELNGPTIIFDDILNEIHNFLAIKSNPYQPSDLIKYFIQNPSLLSRNELSRFINENDWHAGLKPLDVFEEIEDPETKGELSNTTIHSYTKVKYKKGYPISSGKRPYEELFHNLDWVSTEQDTQDEARSKTANIPQVTDKMENIEDESNDLDVQITQNKNVYRMLLYGGPSCASFSPIVAEELNKIYPEKGGLFVELLRIEPNGIFPIIMKRIRERARQLYLKKISQSRSWCKQLEVSLPLQRTIFRKDIVKKMKAKDITVIKGDTIEFPLDLVHFLPNFYKVAKINMPSEIKYPNLDERMEMSIRKIVRELSDSQPRDVKVTFSQAACIYCAAYFLKMVHDLDITDSLKSPSLKNAIDIGITDANDHGYQHILTFIADSINKRKAKKVGNQGVINCILDISGLLFEIDFDKVSFVIQVGHLFFKVLRNYAIESDDEVKFITCKLDNGKITLLSATNEVVQINL